jgi:hypothetical protein
MGESSCLGPICKAMRYREESDGCIIYTPVEAYVPLEAALYELGIDRITLEALLAEADENMRHQGRWRGWLGQAADAERKERDRLEAEAEEAEYLRTHPWVREKENTNV